MTKSAKQKGIKEGNQVLTLSMSSEVVAMMDEHTTRNKRSVWLEGLIKNYCEDCDRVADALESMAQQVRDKKIKV